MFVETPEGDLIGEVHMNWHLYRRRYSMYIDKTQFARVDSGFLAVDFDMRDEGDRKIASVNRDFTGFAREIFTDTGQYVLRLDPSAGISAEGLVKDAAAVAPAEDASTMGAKLTQDQRAVLLSTAIAVDFGKFERSQGLLIEWVFCDSCANYCECFWLVPRVFSPVQIISAVTAAATWDRA